MKMGLVRAMLMKADILMLDEPTGHLDKFNIAWLIDYVNSLKSGEKPVTVIATSHDSHFLESVTTHIIDFQSRKLKMYPGTLSKFVEKVPEAINYFQIKAAKTQFKFPEPGYLEGVKSKGKALLKMADVEFKYPSQEKPTLHGVGVQVSMLSRVAIVGPNGAGKSTFLKLLDGSLQPTEGFVRRHSKLSMARFTQHHIEMMVPDEDSVCHMRRLGAGGIKDDGTSEVTIEEARKYLGRFGLQGDLALQPVRNLSGGQKSRLAFAQIAWSTPHLLMLDEPTNHLDLETIEGLAMALNKFEGGVVLVSHDDRLVSLVADELWVVLPGKTKDKPGRVTVFEGSFEEYKEMLRDEFMQKNLTAGGRIKRAA